MNGTYLRKLGKDWIRKHGYMAAKLVTNISEIKPVYIELLPV